MAKKQTESYIEHTEVEVGREDDYEVTIRRKPGDDGWEFDQSGTVIYLPDDEALEAFILAVTALIELSKGMR